MPDPSAPVPQHLATANDTATYGKDSRLWSIVVGTKATSAVVTVYDGISTSGVVRATIDAATGPITHHFYGARFGSGLFVKLTGGNADCTVVAE